MGTKWCVSTSDGPRAPWMGYMGVDTKGELPPSFCNSLRTIYYYIYSVLFEEGPFDLTTRDMSLEFRYTFGKVLDTQDCPTLRMASHHCVLYLNLIKNNSIFVSITHIHASIHLNIQPWHHHPKTTYHTSIKQ